MSAEISVDLADLAVELWVGEVRRWENEVGYGRPVEANEVLRLTMRRFLASLGEAGYAVVPLEPTSEQLDRLDREPYSGWGINRNQAAVFYQEMIPR